MCRMRLWLAALSIGMASAACGGEGNLLKNPGFEDGFAEWRKPSQMWSVEAGAGYDGSAGLVWRCDDPKHYEYPAQYVRLEPGLAYRIRALVKVDALENGKKASPAVGFEWFDKDGKWLSGAYARPVDDNGILKDGWVSYEGLTRVMTTETFRGGFICYLPKGSTGKVRFDNVSFERVPVKPIEFVVADAYRDTASVGKVRVLASIHANPGTCAARLDYVDAEGVKRQTEPVLFEADKVQFELDVADLAMGKQELLVVLNGEGGAVLGSQSVSFTRTTGPLKRRVTFDSRRRMLLDGKPFFPLGHYVGRMTDEDIQQYRRGPHNFVVRYSGVDAAELDRWQKAGVFVAEDVRGYIYGNEWAMRKGYKTLEDTKAILRRHFAEVGSHPALLMWYLNDEAPVERVEAIAGAHAFLHELDPERATLTCLCHPKTAFDFLPSYDVMAHDCYPIGNHLGRNMMERVTRQMREIDGSMLAMRPLWFIPQTFDWKWCYTGDSLKKCDKDFLRMPTREEMCCMTWQGIACGANGIVSYSYSTIRKNAKDEAFEKAWADTCAMAEEVKKMEEVLLSDEIPVKTKGLPEFVVARAWRHAGRAWYLVVNATREPQTATVALDGAYGSFKTALGRGVKNLSSDGRSLACAFGPMGYAFVALSEK